MAVFAALIVLIGAVAWRPHGLGPMLGSLAAVGVAMIGGAVGPHDVFDAVEAQWRAYVTLLSIMTMTSAAERVGLLERVASWIEPRTRGPVRHAFLVTFVLSAAVAAVLSNDAAILLMTPTVLTLLRTVYPRRNPKFLVPFAVAVFASAGVAPLVISNPMNLIFAEHTGIGFNRYSITMIPIAIVGWLVAYRVLVYIFRDALADEAPALGAWPAPPPRLGKRASIVLVSIAAVLVAYPVMSYLDIELWPVAAVGGAACAIASLASGHSPERMASGVAWPVFPFLVAVFVLAQGLERAGAVAQLHDLYAATPAPIATIGGVSALGSALLNNHPMSLLNALALDRDTTHGFAALIGGDLGPRLTPIGSLASLLWFDLLRKHDVTIRVTTFMRVGVLLTVPTLVVSLAMLWLLAR
ncbi:MAG TPA: ArsB/NhaD family transporter [Kofleriaceae bacterium]|nr:ArsB/NhaD family transporter [Kofleriaceae bacterium]